MKLTWLSLILLAVQFSVPAHAGSGKLLCGSTLDQVQEVIAENPQYVGTFSKDEVLKAVGQWNGGLSKLCQGFQITQHQAFNFGGKNYEICPQVNGSYYIYEVGAAASSHGTLTVQEDQLTVSNATGDISVANGKYGHSCR